MPAVRRTSARGDARRTQILEGALAAIRAQSIADVQLASIAAHAGLRPNHVLYYYASRDDVLIAAVAHAERRLADGRSERLREIADPHERLAAYVRAYLPDDRHDPVWKLWIEGWLRSASRAEFGEVGWEANLGWRADLVEALQHALGAGAPTTEEITAFARRFNFLLDGLAVHMLAGHLGQDEAAELATTALDAELRSGATEYPARRGKTRRDAQAQA
jgi:AcrR family transcriptional regulator